MFVCPCCLSAFLNSTERKVSLQDSYGQGMHDRVLPVYVSLMVCTSWQLFYCIVSPVC